jgi:hypothetical protein
MHLQMKPEDWEQPCSLALHTAFLLQLLKPGLMQFGHLLLLPPPFAFEFLPPFGFEREFSSKEQPQRWPWQWSVWPKRSNFEIQV